MSTLQASPLASELPSASKRPWRRLLVLFLLLLLSIVLYGVLIRVAPQSDAEIPSFVWVWMICFLPYFAACAFVLATRPAGGRWRWIELAIILAGAFLFRVMLLPLPPGLSHDAWRYLWDARVTLHGYSPYVYTPEDKAFSSLHDFLYDNSRFRNVPTIYPPGAQAIYLLSYLLAPSNLFFLKGIFAAFDMLTCGVLALFLARRGLDPRRVVIYAWCPLPVVEFAIEGHVDVVTLTFAVLAVLFAGSNRRGSRALTGFFIGMATLTKIYPILLLAAVIRRRDWALLASCFATIVLGYIPYFILGHGQVLGYLSGYSSEQGGNAGVVQLLIYSFGSAHGYKLAAIIVQQHVVDVIVLSGMSLVVLVLRLLKDMRIEAAVIMLIGSVLAISSHVFPWYTTVLLPWIALLIGPLRTNVREVTPEAGDHKGPPIRTNLSEAAPAGDHKGPPVHPSAALAPTRAGVHMRWGLSSPWPGLAVGAAWYFTCVSLTGYFFNNTQDWHIYYEFVYGVVMAGLSIACALGFWGQLKQWHRWTLEGKPK